MVGGGECCDSGWWRRYCVMIDGSDRRKKVSVES